jgi:DNA-binding transcriptional LysR family regulator
MSRTNLNFMHRIATLPLGALRAFEAAARLGSLKAAADELGVTPAAVSHQVKSLETHLGAALFDRLHRALRLTRTGERLAVTATRSFSDLGRTLDDLAETGLVAGGATLSVSAVPTFAAKWLAPRLHEFQSAYPDIELRLRADDALTDPARDRQVDVALRYGRGPYASELHADRLWPEDVVVAVCSPDLARQLKGPADLVDLRLLRTATPQDAKRADPIGWRSWFEAAGVPDHIVARAISGAPRFGTTQLALEAAVAGRGIALSPRILVEDDLVAGRLVAPFATSIADPFGFWLLHRRDRADELRIKRFTTWIRGAASLRCRTK